MNRIAEPVNSRAVYADSGERGAGQTVCAPFILERFKECTRHPVRAYTANPTTTYWDRSRRGCRRAGMPGRVCGGNEGVDISAREL